MIESAQPRTAPYMVADGGNGLYLKVEPTGTKTFLWRWRCAGTIKKITIGRVGTIELDDAREVASSYTRAVRKGRDPALELKAEKARVKLNIDQAWARFETSYIERRLKPRTAAEYRRIYNKDIKPILGSTLVQSITTSDLRALIRDVTDRAESAGRLAYALLSVFYNWIIEEGFVETSPMFKKSWKVRVRERHLREHEVRWLLKACAALRDRKNAVGRWACAVLALLRLAQRESNILKATEDNVIGGMFVVGAADFKGNREHEVPLPEQVLKLLASVHRPDRNRRYFQRLGNETRNLNVIRAKMAEIAEQPVEHWCIHDLRRTFTTIVTDAWDEAADREVADDAVVEAILGHSLKGVKRHYSHARLLRSKRRVLDWWNGYLDGLLVENAANVPVAA